MRTVFAGGKLVMTAPATLPLIGKVKFREVSKEKLLEFWHGAARRTGLKISYGERVQGVAGSEWGFQVDTTRGAYRTRAVLLAVGRRGTPRTLQVPGENQAKVVYRLVDPAQYRGKHVLVVGGGDSALEAAVAIADEPGTLVTLSHRGEGISRAKVANRERLAAAQETGRLEILMQSHVTKIGAHDVELAHKEHQIKIRNDAVIACLGGILPTAFLKSIGISVETKYGTE